MATISTIGTSSRNYSTVAAWLAAFATGGWEGQCYNDSEFLVTSTIAFSGHATSASDYIKLSAASGQGFQDNANKLTNALKYNQSNGVGIRNNTKYVDTISISEDFVTLVGLQVSQSATGGGGGQIAIRATTNSQTHGVFDSLICENTSGTVSQGVINAREQTIKNCLLIQRGTSGDGIFISYPGSAGLIINNTIVRPSDITAADNGIHSTSGSWKVVNTAVFGFTNFSSGGTPTGCSNNASDVTIGTGSSNQASKTYSSQFQNTSDSTRDFRAKAGADLLENATSTGAPSVDIIGTSRPQGSLYDIGCWELVSGGGSRTISAALAESPDTASAALHLLSVLSAALHEASDTMAATLLHGGSMAIALVESPDVAAIALQLRVNIIGALQEAGDTAAASLKVLDRIQAALIESGDIAAGTIHLNQRISAALQEASDVFFASIQSGSGPPPNVGNLIPILSRRIGRR